MIGVGINGVILRIKNSVAGDISGTPLMGKTSEEWVADAFGAPSKVLEVSTVIDISEKLRSAVDRTKPITVVLYGDTPLINAKTVDEAARRLSERNLDLLRLPRGCVFKTEYLFGAEKLFAQEKTGSGEFEPITDCESMSRINDIIRRRILNYHAAGGVVITDYANTHIDCDVVIERGAVIEPYNFIKGKTVIKSGAHIMPGNYIQNCIIGENTVVDSSRLYDSLVGNAAKVGPFAYIRPNTVIGAGCRIGDFVELKNCVLGDGCKVSHLSYVGDAELGEQCNVGCGVVFANYDGKNKYRSVIGRRVFIGSNANIVAPVTVADGAFIAAGSTITKEVPAAALAIARARQTLIPNWKGNMYNPPDETAKSRTFNFVQLDNGIIDGAATDAHNTRTDNGDNGEQPK